jgi:hypothetical protein
MPIDLAKLQLTNSMSVDSGGELRDLSETEQQIQGGIWNANQKLYIYSSGEGYYAGVHDYDRGVSEPINSSGE